MEIGERISNLRGRLGLTRKRFSEYLGCDINVVSKTELGMIKPSEKLIGKITEVFRVRREWMDTGEEPIVQNDEILKAASEPIGSKIRHLRQEKGVTINEFSKVVGIGSTNISYIERGLQKPSDKTMDKICAALGVEEDWLRFGYSLNTGVAFTSEMIAYLKSHEQARRVVIEVMAREKRQSESADIWDEILLWLVAQ